MQPPFNHPGAAGRQPEADEQTLVRHPAGSKRVTAPPVRQRRVDPELADADEQQAGSEPFEPANDRR